MIADASSWPPAAGALDGVPADATAGPGVGAEDEDGVRNVDATQAVKMEISATPEKIMMVATT